MAQTGYTPISLYYSATAAAAPTSGNLVAGELAINTADGKLFYKDSAGVVQTLATKATGTIGGATTQIQYNLNGALAGSANFVFDSLSNIGIGTSTPSVRLDVNDNNPVRGIVSRVRNSSTSGFTGSQLLFTQNTVADWVIGQPANTNAFAFWGARNSAQDGTEFLRINSTGNVTIGSGNAGQKLVVDGGVYIINSATLAASQGAGLFSFETPVMRYYVGDGTGYSWAFSKRVSSTTTDLMTITDSGNVGIGVTTANQRLEVAGTIRASRSGTPTTFMEMFGGDGSTDPRINVPSGFGVNFSTGGTNRMVVSTNVVQTIPGIDINRGANTTGALNVGACVRYAGAGTQYGLQLIPTANDTVAIYFSNAAGSGVGSISVTSTNTSYVTSSDYRLKENIAPMIGALEKVAKLKPVTYNWKEDGSNGQGFIAHELQEVVPDCVSGTKDATRIEKYEISPAIPAEIDADGKVIKEAVEAVMGEREVPAYQGIDTSFLVATLTAAIQEQQVMINELKAKVAALEAA